jgi:MFS family permease
MEHGMTARRSDETVNGQDRNASEAAATSWIALFRGRNLGCSIVLTGAVAIHALSLRVVITVLPSAVAEIGGLRFFAWTMTIAMVSAIWGAASAARLASSRGLSGAYQIALSLFVCGSLTCAIAPSMAVFLAGRLFQGLGGGLLTALAYTTISRVFPPQLHPRAIALLSAVWGVAALTGPLVGGALAGWGLWRSAFWIDVPFAALIGAAARRTILARLGETPAAAAQPHPVALGRLILLGGSVLTVATASLSRHASTGALGVALAAVLLVAVLRLDERADRRGRHQRLLPTGAFDPRVPLGSVALVMALIGGCTMAVVYLPYVVTRVDLRAPIVGGYLSAILPLSWALAALASASAAKAWAPRLIVLGPALVALGLVMTGWSLTTGSLGLLAAALVPVGGGIGAAWTYLGALMVEFAAPNERDVAAAFISTNNLLSQAFGAAFAGMIANLAGFGDPALGAAEVVGAVSLLFVIIALFPAAALLPAILIARLEARRERLPAMERARR